MKKIIITVTLFLAVCINSTIASPHFNVSYWNHTQNIGGNTQTGISGIGFNANIGDSVTLNVWEFDLGQTTQLSAWTFNGNLFDTTGTIHLTVIITMSGVYSVWGNITTYDFYVTVAPTGINEVSNPSAILKSSVVNSLLSLDLNLVSNKTIEIDIMDLNGKIFRKTNYGIKAGNITISENIEELVNGIYFIRIKTGDEVFCERFLKL